MDKLLKIGSFEEFDKVFDTEQRCKDYLSGVRWGDNPNCPHCGHHKVYITKVGYKCASQLCYKKFTITTKSFIHSSNLELKDWLTCIFLFIKSRGRFTSANLHRKLNWVTIYIVDSKLERIFKNIYQDYGDVEFIFREACRKIFTLSDSLERYKKKNFRGTNILSSTEVIDFSDSRTYDRLLAFCKIDFYYAIYRRFVFYLFCDPKEVLAELYISIAEADEKTKLTGDFIITTMRKQRYRMWKTHISETPSLAAYFRRYQKQKYLEGSKNIARWYALTLLKRDKTTVYNNNLEALIAHKRAEIIEKRKKANRVFDLDFISHENENIKRGRVRNLNTPIMKNSVK